MELFPKMKGQHLPQLSDPDWICNVAFCIDITQHMTELNILVHIQGANHRINETLDKIAMLEGKFGFWEL
jgi:hypothetical protein